MQATNFTYSDNMIHCLCGESFEASLEDKLKDELYEDSFESLYCDEELYTCPRCKSEYHLEIKVQKTVETIYKQLELLEKELYATDIDGFNYPLKNLNEKWIGDSVPLRDGSYITDIKEVIVKDQIIIQYWGLPGENQLSLFEENAA